MSERTEVKAGQSWIDLDARTGYTRRLIVKEVTGKYATCSVVTFGAHRVDSRTIQQVNASMERAHGRTVRVMVTRLRPAGKTGYRLESE